MTALWQVAPRHLVPDIPSLVFFPLWHPTPWTTCPAMSYPQWPYVLPLLMVVRCCMMVVLSAKLFGLFYLRVLRQISTSTVTLMANEVSVSFASFSNTVHALRQRGVSQLLHETFISPLFHLKFSSVNLKNYRIYSILCYGHNLA